MTSSLASNFVSSAFAKSYPLEATKEGLPLQGQVPVTVEQYTGAGGVSVVPLGKEVYYVNSTLATGALTLNLTNNQNYNNMVGRKMVVYVSPDAGNNVIVDITGGPVARAFRLTGDTGDQATITAGGYAVLYFIDTINCLIVGSANCTTA